METFQYNDQISYENNFKRWFLLNCEERTDFQLQRYTSKEAWEVFQHIFTPKLSHSYKINKDGVLEDVLIPETPHSPTEGN